MTQELKKKDGLARQMLPTAELSNAALYIKLSFLSRIVTLFSLTLKTLALFGYHTWSQPL